MQKRVADPPVTPNESSPMTAKPLLGDRFRGSGDEDPAYFRQLGVLSHRISASGLKGRHPRLRLTSGSATGHPDHLKPDQRPASAFKGKKILPSPTMSAGRIYKDRGAPTASTSTIPCPDRKMGVTLSDPREDPLHHPPASRISILLAPMFRRAGLFIKPQRWPARRDLLRATSAASGRHYKHSYVLALVGPTAMADMINIFKEDGSFVGGPGARAKKAVGSAPSSTTTSARRPAAKGPSCRFLVPSTSTSARTLDVGPGPTPPAVRGRFQVGPRSRHPSFIPALFIRRSICENRARISRRPPPHEAPGRDAPRPPGRFRRQTGRTSSSRTDVRKIEGLLRGARRPGAASTFGFGHLQGSAARRHAI